jgi:predicted TIM-barrel fold metal-dependent hydrolase
MARRHPQVWLDTTNVFGSIAIAPAGEPRERLERDLQAAFEAAPDRIFFGTDYPAAMGTLDELHAQVAQSAVGSSQLERLAGNAERFVRESFVIKTRA